MAEIAQLRNPKALALPQVQKLFKDAIGSHPGILGSFEDSIGEYASIVLDPSFCILVGVEKGEYKALSILVLPKGKILPMPQIWLFYNEGSDELKKALIEHSKEFFIGAGYTRIWAINGTGVSDAAWKKAFSGSGNMTRVGSVFVIEAA